MSSLKGMINSLTKFKLEKNLLRSRNLSQKPLQTTFVVLLTSFSVNIPSNSGGTCSDFLNIPYISDSDAKQAICCPRSTKCVGPDQIPNCIMRGCPQIFTPLLRLIFNLSTLTEKFLSLLKQEPVVPIFKKGSSALITNYRPISILNNSFEIFESLIHGFLSFSFKLKLNPSDYVLLNKNLL
jgi:hypothetical protein